MHKFLSWMTVVAALVMVSIVAPLRAIDDEDGEIPDKDIPKKIVEAVKKNFPGSELLGALRFRQKDGVVYEAIVKHERREWRVRMKEDGTVVYTIKPLLRIEEWPKKVTATLEAKYTKKDGWHIDELQEKTKGDVKTYLVLLKRVRRNMKVEVDANGKILWAKPGVEK